MKRLLLLITLALAATGCSSMAPSYRQPAPPVSAAWPTGEAYRGAKAATTERAAADIPWQDYFVDAKLRRLIALALESNRDLKVAALNIERYQALYQIQRADLLPKLDATAGASFQRVPEHLSGTGKVQRVDQLSVGLGVASYELDLFGRVRSLKDQALEQYLATEHARRSVQIGIVSQVALGYLTLAADREHLQFTRETLASQESSYKLTSQRYDMGVASALDLAQAQTSVDAARVEIDRYTTLVAQDINALTLLVGLPISEELLPASLSENLTALSDIAPGLPSEVLLSRPDILQAEAGLKGANANIGAAEAAFFPRITLVSSLGLGSDALASLFKSGAFAWSVAPSVTLPIFDGGTNKANLKVAQVDRDLALARYEKAIQTAFREVADALAQRGTIDRQLAAQQSLTDATDRSYRLSRQRYEMGVDSYLAVLDSQRSWYAAQQNLIAYRLARLGNLATLYGALGGGGK